jgi:HEAT repeat protein
MKLLPDLSLDEQAALLAFLVDRLGTTMTPHILKFAASDSAGHREIGLRGLAKIGDVSAVPVLMKSANSEGLEKKLALNALRRIKGEGANEAIIEVLDNAEPTLKAELIAVLHDRNVVSLVPRFLQYMSHADAKVANAACSALGDLAGKAHLRAILDNLLQQKNGKTTAAAETAFLRSARRTESEAVWVPRLSAELSAATADKTRMILLRLLGGLPCEHSFAVLKTTAMSDSNKAVQDVALRVLFDWPGVEVLPTLTRVVNSSDSKVHRVLALRGYVRVLGTGGDEAKPYVQPALEAARRALTEKVTRRDAALAIASMAPVVAALNPDTARAALMEAASRNKDDKGIRITVGKCLRSLKLNGKPSPKQGNPRETKARKTSPKQQGVFFNGKTLAGWQGNEKYWKVEDGAIVGDNREKLTKNLYIWSDVLVKDFYLVVDVKIEPWDRKAGIQFRSRKVGEFGAYGYQADAGGGFWGRLFHEHGRNHLDSKDYGFKASKKDDWNRYEILAVGDCIWTAINGTLSVSIKDPKGEKSGHIAFQVHAGKPQTARYKIVKLVHNPEVKLEGHTEKQLRAALRDPLN